MLDFPGHFLVIEGAIHSNTRQQCSSEWKVQCESEAGVHGMGLDVHEVAGWPKGTERPQKPHLSLGGVRIEDDILITANGCENLSAHIPKEIDEIEALMKAR